MAAELRAGTPSPGLCECLDGFSWPVIAALLLAAIAVAATFGAIGYPLGTLGDEWAKIDAVRTGNNRYYHPLLMIELTQAANLFLQASDLQSIAEVGRL